tara:strand:+ start:8346 stop:9545 length:1200 start_codon:yes stop_codon:yes gene_type:complete
MKSIPIINKVFFLFILFVILYNSSSVLITVNSDLGTLLLIPATIIVLLINISNKKLPTIRGMNSTTFYCIFVIIGLFTFFYNFDSTVLSPYIRFFLIITLSLLLSNIYSFENFVIYYLRIIFIISIFSLIGYSLANLFNFGSFLPTITNINHIDYYNGYLFYIIQHAPERNIGIFWEPGIFTSFLIIALIFEVSIKEKTNKVNFFLFTFTILTTLSTSGIFLLPFLLILLINKRNQTRSSLVFNTFLLLFIIIVQFKVETILQLLNSMNPDLFGKVLYKSNSVMTRLNGPLVDMAIFSRSPMLGVGYSDYYNIWRNLTFRSDVLSQTSTITYFLAVFGFMGISYAVGWIKGILNMQKVTLLAKLTILSIFVVILSKEPHQNNVLMYLIFFYFLQNKSVA